MSMKLTADELQVLAGWTADPPPNTGAEHGTVPYLTDRQRHSLRSIREFTRSRGDSKDAHDRCEAGLDWLDHLLDGAGTAEVGGPTDKGRAHDQMIRRLVERALMEIGNNIMGASAASSITPPIPMLLWCPMCRARHIDEGEFATKVHHTHSCQGCGLTWRPAVVATVGVQFLPGFKNEDKT